MKKLLISAPTELEVGPLRSWLAGHGRLLGSDTWSCGRGLLRLVVTGPGVPCVCTHLAIALSQFQPAWLLHIGVAGAREGRFAPGDVVEVVSDQFGDIGAEAVDGRLMTMFDLNLWNAALPPWAGEQMYNPGRWISRPMPVASGMTVNRIPGTMAGQLELANRFDFDIETMEGAGVFYAALSLDVHFTSLRGISNLIEPRDKSRWQLSSAVDAVCAVAMEEVAAYMHL